MNDHISTASSNSVHVNNPNGITLTTSWVDYSSIRVSWVISGNFTGPLTIQDQHGNNQISIDNISATDNYVYNHLQNNVPYTFTVTLPNYSPASTGIVQIPTSSYLSSQGYSVQQLVELHYPVQDVIGSNFSVSGLLSGGVSPFQIITSGSYSVSDILASGITTLNVNNPQDLTIALHFGYLPILITDNLKIEGTLQSNNTTTLSSTKHVTLFG